MHSRSYYFINAITMYRLLATPVLVYLAVTHQLQAFKWLLAFSFFTDAIDGYLARHFHVASVFGARLDSVADDLTIAAAIVGVWVFKKEFLDDQWLLVVILIVLYLFQTFFALFKYGKMTSFHTYLAKISAVAQGVFFILLFFLPEVPYELFRLAAILTILDVVEEIILVRILPVWQSNVKGIYWLLTSKRQV